METDAQMATVPDPQVQRTVAMIMTDYVAPYREHGRPARVVDIGAHNARVVRRTSRARAASGLEQPPLSIEDLRSL